MTSPNAYTPEPEPTSLPVSDLHDDGTPTLLQVDTTIDRDRGHVRLSGEIDLATVDGLRSAVTAAVADGARHVVVDLEQVSYIDSSGLGTLVGAHKRLTGLGGTLVVWCTQPRLLRLFTLTGVDQVLTLASPEAGPASVTA
jgi:anti-sigma B factor antagonist